MLFLMRCLWVLLTFDVCSVDHFMMFVLACIDVDRRRRLTNPKAPYREVSKAPYQEVSPEAV